MKILKLVLVIIISITPFSVGFGQSTYEPDEFYSSQGDSNLRSGSDSLSDLISNLDHFSRIEDNETKKILRGSIAQASWAKMNNVRRNVDQANLKLHYALNEEKNELRYIYKKKALTRVNELAVAKAWWDSPTCKRQIPRRDWFNLSAEERAMYSHRYMQYHNPELFESINEMTLDIPESEYAMAWNIRHLSNPGVPSWKEVKNFKSKNNFRKSYYSHKLAKVNPKIFISEEEFANAWEIAQIGISNPVRWDQVLDSSKQSKFRKNYLALREKQLDSSILPLGRSNEENTDMVALASLTTKK
ncbi:hypothetical protein OAP38_03260 [Opitutales bacterium]|nr:hypothetical protein [Opitutales bacterium]